MSQVVVCQDSFGSKRANSLEQEKSITKDDSFTKWQRSDVTKTLMIERFIVVLLAPIVFFWSLLLFGAGLAMSVCLFLFKVLGRITSFLKRLVT